MAATLAIPGGAEDFTVEWMNRALAPHLGNARILACDAKDSPIPGQTAEIVLINIETDSDTLPDRFVAKITSRNPVVIEQVIANYDQYRRETSFYRDFPDIGIAVPRVFYQDHDPDAQAFVLLMQDLAPSESPSWAIKTDQAIMALEALPAFHARWWNYSQLKDLDWLVQTDNLPFFAAAFGAAHHASSALEAHYENPATTTRLMALANERLESLMTFIQSRPFTFVHGDYHAKQMFFPTDAGGEFAVIDWQFPFVAPGAWDFARMTGMCLATDERRAREKQLLQNYHQQLLNKGVQNYSLSDLETDYRIGLLISQMVMCVAHGDTDVNIFKAECDDLDLDWQDVMLLRTQRALEDWQVSELLESL